MTSIWNNIWNIRSSNSRNAILIALICGVPSGHHSVFQRSQHAHLSFLFIQLAMLMPPGLKQKYDFSLCKARWCSSTSIVGLQPVTQKSTYGTKFHLASNNAWMITYTQWCKFCLFITYTQWCKFFWPLHIFIYVNFSDNYKNTVT